MITVFVVVPLKLKIPVTVAVPLMATVVAVVPKSKVPALIVRFPPMVAFPFNVFVLPVAMVRFP